MTTKIPVELSSTPGIVDGSNATAITIDSSEKVGIGTGSPARNLHVYKASSGATSTADSVLVVEDDDNTEISILGGSSSVLAINFGHSGDADEGILSFNTTSGSENMTLSSTKDITLRTTSTNSTAGDINFKSYNTTIMHVDGGNNRVGIGTDSPDTLLNLKDAGSIEVRLEADSNNSGQEDCFIRFYTDGKTQEGILGMDNNNSSSLFSSNTENAMVFGCVSNLPVVFATNNTERMQISAAGNVGVGITSPSAPVHIQTNTSETNDSVTGLMITTLSTGTTTTNFGGAIQFQGERNNGVVQNTGLISSQADVNSGSDISSGFRFSTGTAGVVGEKWRLGYNGLSDMYSTTSTLRLRTGTTGTNGQVLSGFEGSSTTSNGTQRFVIYSNGNIQNTNNSYGQISDIKLKENIVDATDKLSDIKQVKVRNFNFIGDSTKQIGVVAQELETVFPALVETIKDLDADGNQLETETKSVKYSVFVPILIKAMQEQQEQIEQLKAEVQSLKGE